MKSQKSSKSTIWGIKGNGQSQTEISLVCLLSTDKASQKCTSVFEAVIILVLKWRVW